MTIKQNYKQKEALVSFVNNVAELVLASEQFLDPNTNEILMLGIEDDSNIIDSECSSNIKDIRSYLDTVFDELKARIKAPTKELTHYDKVRLIDKDEETIAWKIWTKGDIKSRLKDMKDNKYIKCKITDELVDKISSNINIKSLCDCTDDDWQIIDNAIMDAIKE